MGWLFIIVASICEMLGVVGLKKYASRKSLRNGVLFLGGFGASFALLYASFQYLQISVAYAVWVGIGTAGAVVVNMFFFGEAKSIMRVISLAAIIIGVTGLKAIS